MLCNHAQRYKRKLIALGLTIPFACSFAVSSGLFRSGSKNMAGGGDPADALFDAIEHGNLDRVVELIDANLITKFNT